MSGGNREFIADDYNTTPVTSLLLETGALQNKPEANTLAKVKGLEIAKKNETQQPVREGRSVISGPGCLHIG